MFPPVSQQTPGNGSAAPPNPAVNPQNPAQVPPNPANPAVPAAQPNTEGLFDNRGVQGSPHPGEMTPIGTPAPAAPTVPAVPDPANPESAAINNGPAIANPAAPAAAAQNPQGARAIAAAMGLAVANTYADDATFVQAVLNAATQGEQYRRQLEQVRQQALQQAPAVAPPPVVPPAPKPWQGPEWNPAWDNLITKSADGVVGIVPGADPAILGKYHQFQAHRKQFADKLISDPESILGPMIDARAKTLAEEQARAMIAQQSTATYVEQFVQQNSDWLHAKDQQGQVIRDQGGRPFLSAAGQRFQAHAQQAQNLGITDLRAQEQYARQALQNEYLTSQYRQLQQQEQANRQTLAGNRTPNAAGTTPGTGTQTTPNVPPPAGGDLRAMLAAAMAQAGVTDATLQNGMG